MLNEDYIFLDVKVTNKNQLLGFIADKAHEYNICDNREGLLEDLIKREAEFPTGLQDGFAIPHARSNHVKKAAILYLRTDEAIEQILHSRTASSLHKLTYGYGYKSPHAKEH